MRFRPKSLLQIVFVVLTCLLLISRVALSARANPMQSPDSSTTDVESAQPVEAPSFDCSIVVDVPLVECEALVALYISTNGDAWNDNTNWLVSTSVSDWYGVTVAGGNVTELSLVNNNMVGTLPQDLEDLSMIEKIAFGFNELSGGIPAWLGSMTTLQDLAIGGNQFGGGIPAELGNLVNLTGLLLFGNGLTGSIPSELGQLDSLIDLHLNNNSLSGNIPPELGDMDSIQHLWMGENQLEGSMPADLGDLSTLLTLQLQNNQLTGPIPPQLSNLTYLYTLDLENNQLGGDIPESLTNLEELCLPGEYDCSEHGLDLGYNRLNTTGLSQTLWNFLAVKDPDWTSTQTITMSISTVDPDTAPNDVNTEITISGDGFDSMAQVFLGGTELVQVSFINDTELTATIPWGLVPGNYNVKVTNPDEASFTLVDTFNVTDGFGEFITNGPYGGATYQLALQPGNPSTVYALMWGVGLFISQDGGENWSMSLDHDWVVQLDFDANDPDVLYMGGEGSDFYRSQDNGVSWDPLYVDSPPSGGCYKSYPAAHPTEPGKVYLSWGSCPGGSLDEDTGGVYYSNDFGNTWELRSTGLTNRDIQSLAIDFDGTTTTLFAGAVDGSIYYSDDGGLNWVEATDQLEGYVLRLFINQDMENVEAWGITWEDLVGPRLYRSSGDLDTWEEIEIDVHMHGQMSFVGGNTWLASGHLYKFVNGEIPPVDITPVEIEDSLPQAFVINPDNTQVMYLGTNEGVYKSSDGGSSWLEINQGLAALMPEALAVSSSDPNIIYVRTNAGIYKSQTGGNAWQQIDHGGGGFPGGKGLLAVDHFDSERIYFDNGCQDQFCIDVSSNGGVDWTRKIAGFPGGFEGWWSGAYAITPSPHTPGLVVAGTSLFNDTTGDYQGIFYLSEDYGETWDFVLPDSAPIDRIIEVEFDAFDPDLVYAGTDSTGLWRSQDRGVTWAKLSFDEVVYPIRVKDIAVHPDVPNKVFVRMSNALGDGEWELWVSEDRGESWTPLVDVSYGGEGDLVFSPPIKGKTFYIMYSGCYGGLYGMLCRSYDEGLTWSPVGGVPRPLILVAASDGERSILYMGSAGGLTNAAEDSLASTWDQEAGNISGSGVYRFTQLLLGEIFKIFLPMFDH